MPGGSAPPGSTRARSVADSAAARTAVAHGRFDPGIILVERYRIVALAGRGGMGEVYRADDLKLGQPVALKFLPPALQGDDDRRERFYNEVRMARQVTHPAVCRVHDVGEVDGRLFLSMEYVDGEDLGSLLRRIGRLPQDKATELARQLCAGLAAAHDKGVLHRDLKPGNVMVDGRGRVRITDFGLSGLVDGIDADDVRSGTPAYMSPEQLAGRDVTVRSDVYALGLVLYELFTGKRAFDGRTIAELSRQREELPEDPSSVIGDLDPATERAILRCLEKDPADRPQSAMAVAAALPGGDPLAAALAAGETPSPEMVAALATGEGLAPAWAAACVAVVAVALIASPMLAPGQQLAATAPLERSAAALEDHARELVRRVGYRAPPADEAVGWGLDVDYLQWVQKNDKSPGRWAGIAAAEPPLVIFWYRSSPRVFVSVESSGRVSYGQPAQTVSGMTSVQMDTKGRLVLFSAVPPQIEEPRPPAAEPDWAVLFAEAGLDRSRFRSVPPLWIPEHYADHRAAWEGPYASREDIPVRIEAASVHGIPTYFEVVGPWGRPMRMLPFQLTAQQTLGVQVSMAVFLGVMVMALLLARRHLLLGRGDRRGATRLALFTLSVGTAVWAMEANHAADAGAEIALFGRGTGFNLLVAALIFVLYLALEPFLRRRWPRALVTWTRVLAGRISDPLVGRDVLVGAAGGALMTIIAYGSKFLPRLLGAPPQAPWWFVGLDPLLGPMMAIAGILDKTVVAVGLGLGVVLSLLLLRTIVRWEWLAAAILVIVLAAQPALLANEAWWIVLPVAIVIRVVPVVLSLRFGVLPTIVCIFVGDLLFGMPITGDFSSWKATPTLMAFAVVIVLVIHGFRSATAGRRLLGERFG